MALRLAALCSVFFNYFLTFAAFMFLVILFYCIVAGLAPRNPLLPFVHFCTCSSHSWFLWWLCLSSYWPLTLKLAALCSLLSSSLLVFHIRHFYCWFVSNCAKRRHLALPNLSQAGKSNFNVGHSAAPDVGSTVHTHVKVTQRPHEAMAPQPR